MRKFAKVQYSQTDGEIKGPKLGSKEQFIDKYNPFVLKNIELETCDGFEITLPMTETEAVTNPEKASVLLLRTLEAVSDKEIEVISLPNYIDLEIAGLSTHIADGIGIVPYFIADVLSMLSKSIAIEHAQVLILCQENKNTELVRRLLWHLPEKVNYLLVSGENLLDDADRIFSETGLEVGFIEFNKLNFSGADIIINCMENRQSFEYSLKRNAAYFELCRSPNLFAILTKRPEIAAADNYELTLRGKTYSPAEFELLLYMRSKAYRYLLRRGFDPAVSNYVKDEIKAMNVRVKSLFCIGRRA